MFVKSKGCLNSGKPEQEQFYNVKNFTRDKTNPVPTAANVKIEALSKQEKQTVVELAFKDAEAENYALKKFRCVSNHRINTHWENLLDSRRMEEDAIVKISHSRFLGSQFSRGDFLHLHHNQRKSCRFAPIQNSKFKIQNSKN
ncbi:hypothetical protein [Nostoc sp. 'Peltigera malacea cyanobiont' DB3992]|uniref:hypothetical protein n=1 Tax=Nostoc sp. 'Peltigera malacea cyanobiont' DB3992 TaxID=1206980 RepID=UPI0015D46C73|nr:hypothetical protein [Nostoc sp. 'Peltigera malacea cyanobiont' DB3992]